MSVFMFYFMLSFVILAVFAGIGASVKIYEEKLKEGLNG